MLKDLSQDELYLDGIELGIGAFYDTRVKKVTFSDYYTEIPDYLFASSKILEEVVLPEDEGPAINTTFLFRPITSCAIAVI